MGDLEGSQIVRKLMFAFLPVVYLAMGYRNAKGNGYLHSICSR